VKEKRGTANKGKKANLEKMWESKIYGDEKNHGKGNKCTCKEDRRTISQTFLMTSEGGGAFKMEKGENLHNIGVRRRRKG
jgi:hypothetical protein